jgi:hypothetical protein
MILINMLQSICVPEFDNSLSLTIDKLNVFDMLTKTTA